MLRLERTLRDTFRPMHDQVYRLRHSVGVVDIAGVSLKLRHPEISARMFKVLHKGRYETAERTLIDRWLHKDDRILECGAAIGFLAIYCMKILGTHHYAVVEPNPRLRELLSENFALNGLGPNMLPFSLHAAVTPFDGTVEFGIDRNYWASSVQPLRNEAARVTVPAMTLPTIVKAMPFVPNAIILDIEGGEVGLPLDHFDGFDKVIIEVHTEMMGNEAVDRLLSSLRNGFAERDRVGSSYFFERKKA